MPGMGPAPKRADQRARRNTTFAMTQLPAGGRTGPTPEWPLGSDVELETKIALAKVQLVDDEHEVEWASTSRDRSAARRRVERTRKKLAELEAMRDAASATEREIWRQLWRTPQAAQWEKHAWYRDVALYARHQAKGEAGSLADSVEARQRGDRLGLNDQAMLRLRWEVAPTPEVTMGAAPSRGRRSTYRDLRVVGE